MKLRYLLAALVISALPVSAAHAFVSITIAPPALVTYEQPACPTDGYLWTPGYWAYDYDASNYYWVGGVWVPPPQVGYLWTPPYWGFSNGIYAFNDGYWGPTIGFYGGINYGYGYGGYGYYGGRWDGGHFRYNTAITRVNTNVIHNTYVDRNAIRNTTTSRAAFNGRGGINARPDAGQLAAAHGPHVGATGLQTKALQTAKTNHPAGPATNIRGPVANNTRTTPANTGVHNPRTDTRTNNLSRGNSTGRNGTTLTRTNSRTGSGNTTRTHNPQVTRTPQVTHTPQVTRAPRVTHQATTRTAPPRGGSAKKEEKKP